MFSLCLDEVSLLSHMYDLVLCVDRVPHLPEDVSCPIISRGLEIQGFTFHL